MNLVVINDDNGTMTVIKDGKSISEISSVSLPSNVHAVQWDGTQGEVEIMDPTTKKIIRNDPLTSIADYQFAINAWDAKYAEMLATFKEELYNTVYADRIEEGMTPEEAAVSASTYRDNVTELQF